MIYRVAFECRKVGAIGIFWHGETLEVEASSKSEAMDKAVAKYKEDGLECRMPKFCEEIGD